MRLATLASETCLQENKKQSATKYYLQWALNLEPLPFRSATLLSKLAWNLLVRLSLNWILFQQHLILELRFFSYNQKTTTKNSSTVQENAKPARKGEHQTWMAEVMTYFNSLTIGSSTLAEDSDVITSWRHRGTDLLLLQSSKINLNTSNSKVQEICNVLLK